MDLFWSFKTCINGFKSSRSVISIDETHLYGMFDVKLLIVITIDVNENVFPLAYALVTWESFEYWLWFISL